MNGITFPVIGTLTLLTWRRTQRAAAARREETAAQLRKLTEGEQSWSGS